MSHVIKPAARITPEQRGLPDAAPDLLVATHLPQGSATPSATCAAASQQPATEHEPRHLNEMPRVAALKVLLAEDVRANQQIVVRTLERRGHSVDVAANGRQAVEFAMENTYDVILMDVQMPVMDGLQATTAIRARHSQKQVPIVALTAHAMVGDRQRCLDAGMDDYLAKPLDIVRLVQLVEGYAPTEHRL